MLSLKQVVSNIIAFGTSMTTQAFSDAATVGTAATAARSDHKHGFPAAGTTVVVTKVEITSSFTTTSTSLVDVTGLTMTVSTASAANNVEILWIQPLIYHSAGSVQTECQIYDGTGAAAISQTQPGFPAIVNYQICLVIGKITTLATGGRTIKARVSTPSGTFYVYGSAIYTPSLVAKEYR